MFTVMLGDIIHCSPICVDFSAAQGIVKLLSSSFSNRKDLLFSRSMVAVSTDQNLHFANWYSKSSTPFELPKKSGRRAFSYARETSRRWSISN